MARAIVRMRSVPSGAASTPRMRRYATNSARMEMARITSSAVSSNGRNTAVMRPPSWASTVIVRFLLGGRASKPADYSLALSSLRPASLLLDERAQHRRRGDRCDNRHGHDHAEQLGIEPQPEAERGDDQPDLSPGHH